MGIVHTCNGCNEVTPEQDLKRVRVVEATMPGLTYVEIGLVTDPTTEGVLCGECREALHIFVGEQGLVVLPHAKPEPITA